MTRFRGEVRSVAALLDAATASSGERPARGRAAAGVRHTAADNARVCRDLLASGESLDACWRFGILQTLDDYTSTLRRGGLPSAAEVFAHEPDPTGAPQLDAAFAALAEYLAQRDGWTPPAWSLDPARRTDPWYPAVPDIFRDDADRQSPLAFRRRGILLTDRSLARA